MKTYLAGALALALAASPALSVPAFAGEPAQFRTAAPTNFSTDDLMRYGLSPADAGKVAALQAKGHPVKVMSAAEAQRYHAGQFSRQTTWLLIGAAVIIVVVAIAAN